MRGKIAALGAALTAFASQAFAQASSAQVFYEPVQPAKEDYYYGKNDPRTFFFQYRLEQYEEKTSPLIKFYDDQGLLETVAGDKPPDEVGEKIRALLATLRMEDEA